ncbi:MAG: hypothetical protein C0524_06120 [Rhodobacter sp.]|nr:hypothetical protein [Rhodobacter sp.]
MVKKLDQISPEERDTFMRLWVDKAVKVKATAARFGVSERTARNWSYELGLDRGGRGFGGAARRPPITAAPWAGQEAEADPANVYDRATVNGADGFYVERAKGELGEATAREVARASLDMLHRDLSDWTGSSVLTDDDKFVTVGPPEKVSSGSVEMKALTLRVTRRLARHTGDGPKEKPR